MTRTKRSDRSPDRSHGTATLFAAAHVAGGKVIVRLRRHRPGGPATA
jgi:hypothetical protein